MPHTNTPIIVYQCKFTSHIGGYSTNTVLFEQEALYKFVREDRMMRSDIWWHKQFIHAKFIIKLKNVHYPKK